MKALIHRYRSGYGYRCGETWSGSASLGHAFKHACAFPARVNDPEAVLHVEAAFERLAVHHQVAVHAEIHVVVVLGELAQGVRLLALLVLDFRDGGLQPLGPLLLPQLCAGHGRPGGLLHRPVGREGRALGAGRAGARAVGGAFRVSYPGRLCGGAHCGWACCVVRSFPQNVCVVLELVLAVERLEEVVHVPVFVVV